MKKRKSDFVPEIPDTAWNLVTCTEHRYNEFRRKMERQLIRYMCKAKPQLWAANPNRRERNG